MAVLLSSASVAPLDSDVRPGVTASVDPEQQECRTAPGRISLRLTRGRTPPSRKKMLKLVARTTQIARRGGISAEPVAAPR
jgi:hypothetical protein